MDGVGKLVAELVEYGLDLRIVLLGDELADGTFESVEGGRGLESEMDRCFVRLPTPSVPKQGSEALTSVTHAEMMRRRTLELQPCAYHRAYH